MFVQWSNEKHSLGLPEIDQQHQELFLITNQIHDSLTAENTQKELNSLFGRLYAYTKYHFTSEEDIFKQYGYPSTIKHKEQHKVFTQKIKTKMVDFRDNPQIPVDEILDFLVEWIVNHIQGDDRQYRDYYRDKKIDISVQLSSRRTGKKAIDTGAQSLWKKKKLAMEIFSIDKQHKEFIMILQQFNDLQKASEERRHAFTPTLIEKLFFYAQYHFSYEEELMSKFGYPKTLEHRELHQDFIMRIQDFSREYGLEKETLNDEIIYFLKDWTINHILKEDAKYKDLVQRELKKAEEATASHS